MNSFADLLTGNAILDRLRLRVEIMWHKGHSSSDPQKAADKLATKSATNPANMALDHGWRSGALAVRCNRPATVETVRL